MSDPSQNRVTEYRYNGDGQLTQLIARNAATEDQETEWIYGTTLSESGVASSLLVRAKKYPESSASSDRVEFKYNRLGQVTEIKDQAGTVHVGEYDALGRLLHDRATVLGSGIDGTVRRLSASYNVRGRLDQVSSHSSATVGAGSVVNDVKFTYNGFNQLLAEAQAHDGVVGSETPQVEYSYADGSNLTVRRTQTTYPNGRAIATGYGTGGSLDDLNNRITSYEEWGTAIATYLRRGVNSTVKVEYVEPEVELTYLKLSGEPNGDGGDQYTGLDRFNRIVDIRWLQGSVHTAVDRYEYGFDRASNRRYRHNATGSDWDEYYTYDGLSQLKDLQRGTLNGTNTGISGTPSWEEGFTFDPTGNWSNYLTKVSGSTTLNQNRTHNPVNEIATIASSAATVGYDPAGNMTTMPKVGDWSTAQTLKWDAWNRLVEIREGGTLISQYRYDGMFRRVSKASAEDTYLGNTWQTRHYYYSDRWQVLEERLDTEASAARQFIWGARYRDDLILRDRYDDPSPSGSSEEPHDGRLYVTHDQWHVTSVLQPDGTVFERYAYDAFGGSIVLGPDYSIRDASICSWETRYGAYRFDSESELYQVKFRYLNSELGRWTNRDPIEEEGGFNLYRYQDDSPTSGADPLGLAPGNGWGCTLPAFNNFPWDTISQEDQEAIARDCGICHSNGDKRKRPKSQGGVHQNITRGVPTWGDCFLHCLSIQYGIGEGFSPSASDIDGLAARVITLFPVYKPWLGIRVVGDASKITNLTSLTGFGMKLGIGKEPMLAARAFGTRRLFGAVGRVAPIIGYGLLALDAFEISLCMYDCLKD